MEAYTYIHDTLIRLLRTASPTGHTDQAIALVEREVRQFGFASERTRKGGLLVHVPGQDNHSRRLLTAHVDTLGAMVKEVLIDGRLRVERIGGYAWNTVEGESCDIIRQDGSSISGTAILHNTSAHNNRNLGTTERTDENMEVIVDARVKDKGDVHALGVHVGDFVAWHPRVAITDQGYIKSRHLDDKASVAILLGLLMQLQNTPSALPHGLELLISNNEEIGYGGNSNIAPEVVEYLAVDMGVIGDGLTTDEHAVSICAMDSSGPYHEGFRRHLVSLAKRDGLNYAVDIYPYYNSDASAAVRAGHDVRHALIGPGVANSHAYERTHIDGLRNTFLLLWAYAMSPLLP